MNKFKKMLFVVEENTNVSADLEPAVSIDMTNRIVKGIQTLQRMLGITDMTPMASGTTITRYKTTVTKAGNANVAEGEIVPLSKVERKPEEAIVLKLNKYRKLTTAEAISKVGRNVAINQTDEALINEIRSDIKKSFFKMITTGKGTGTQGATLQAAVANTWAKLQEYFEDTDATPVFFLNPIDVATYLGQAAITTQTAFGFSYLENFLGMGNAVITPQVTAGTVYGTAVQNLHGAYVSANSDLSEAFDLMFDSTGLVGMTHGKSLERTSIETLILSGVVFYPEDATGVVKTKIQGA